MVEIMSAMVESRSTIVILASAVLDYCSTIFEIVSEFVY